MPELLHTLTDDFADGVLDPVKWPAIYGTSGVVEQNGRAEFAKSGGSLCTPAKYTLPGSGVFCRVHPSEGSTTRADNTLDITGMVKTGTKTAKFDTLRVAVNRLTGKLGWARIEDLFYQRWAEQTAYDPTAHAWIQVREDGGSVFLETSPDGIGWTTQFVRPLPAGPLSTPGAINLGTSAWFSGGTQTAPAWIGSLNVTP